MPGKRIIATLAVIVLLSGCTIRSQPGSAIEVVKSIPTAALSTSQEVGLDASPGCRWAADLVLDIAMFPPTPMARAVADTMRRADGDGLTHLAWLRIKGHYAIEQVVGADPTGACSLILDISAPSAIRVLVYRADSAPRATAFCPIARQVASRLDHVDSRKPVRGKRIRMLAALALAAGCTVPANPAVTNHCAKVPVDTICEEWAQLDPQPTFTDMMRPHTRSTAPNEVSWAALYFCGAIPGWQYRVILAKSRCGLYTSDKSLRISVETLSIAAAAITVFPGQIRRHRTTVHGRDAVIREQTEHGTRHRYYLAIPGYPDQVIVADLTMPQPTRCALDTVTSTLVELSRPSG